MKFLEKGRIVFVEEENGKKEREIRVNIEITRIKGRRVTGLPFKSKLFMAVGFDVDGERV